MNDDDKEGRTHRALFARVDSLGRRVDDWIEILGRTHAEHRQETRQQVESVRADVHRLADNFVEFRDAGLDALRELREVKVENAEIRVGLRAHEKKLEILPGVASALERVSDIASKADERSARHSRELLKAKARANGKAELEGEIRTRSDRVWSRLGPVLAFVVGAAGVAVTVWSIVR